MNLFKRLAILSLFFVASHADIATARTVYMNDNSEVEAQSAWKDGDTVYLRITDELCLDFPASEINVAKSAITSQPGIKPVPTRNELTAPPQARAPRAVDELIEVAGHRRDLNDIFGRNNLTEMDEIFTKSFSPALAEKALKGTLTRRLSQRELAEVLAWYKTSIGKKVVEADSVLDYNGHEHILTYVSNTSQPGLEERKRIAGQLDDIAGGSELEARLSKQIMVKLMQAIPPDFPNVKELKQKLQDAIPTPKSTREKAVNRMAYTYRYLSLPELRRYQQFMGSSLGRKYMGAVRESTEEIFKKVVINMDKEFRKDVKNLW